MNVLIIVLLLAAFLFLFFKLILWYATTTAKTMVERRHRDAELVLTTGRIPPRWVPHTSPDGRRLALARKRALRRLDSLMSYMRRTTLVDSDETRETMLAQLGEVRERWRHDPWNDIRPEGPAGSEGGKMP